MVWLVTAAFGQQISLGAGRIAVLDPGVAVSAVTSSAPNVVDVVSSPPLLFLIGLKAGVVQVSVESAGGARSWGVRVEPNGSVAPSGGPGLVPGGEMLALPIGTGVLCTITGGTTYTRIDEPFAQVLPFGAARWFVQLDGPGTQDIAFEVARGKPRVMTLTQSAPGSPPPEPPAGCVRPTESLNLVVGQALDVPVGRKYKALLVGAPSVLFLAPTEGVADTIHLVGLKPGTTTILARATDSEVPWMRTVVVARAP